jgi:hypothetical protein
MRIRLIKQIFFINLILTLLERNKKLFILKRIYLLFIIQIKKWFTNDIYYKDCVLSGI